MQLVRLMFYPDLKHGFCLWSKNSDGKVFEKYWSDEETSRWREFYVYVYFIFMVPCVANATQSSLFIILQVHLQNNK